ncbi:MAG: hypothetical protein HY740_01185 [Chloroflexi bacterium]|nr:hypothetical protein [Chloroflexota bacterium]
MNKKWIVSVTVATVVVLALSLTAVGVAAAQTPIPPRPFNPGAGGYGRGAMGAGGYGFMAQNVNDAVMHDAMYDSFAKALGLSRSDLEARVAKGETLAQIASAKGISAADFNKIWTDARKAGIDAAVAKGYFTKDQAAWMVDRSINRGGYGPGNHPYFGTTPTK